MLKRISGFGMVMLLMMAGAHLQARENAGISGKRVDTYARLTAGCSDATDQIDLDINNVRARILGAGDFWWDLNIARYEIPKIDPSTGITPVSSSFAGALWIGGIDAGGQLKIAAQTYRQSGNDFWPGPLNATGSIDEATCNAYDRHWKMYRDTIEQVFFNTIINNGGTPGDTLSTPLNPDQIPKSIREWPGYQNEYATGKASEHIDVDKPLAPFVDINGNGIYEPQYGEYPDIDGDEAIFWVYNDKGNIHLETGGDAIGLEIQALAFAFQTNDEINDMTFYKYKVINYATTSLDSTYFGQWVDSDIGCFNDDWVGCDTVLSLGMSFNGDQNDEPCPAGYGLNPPIFGTDFFQGPTKYIYNDAGSIIDSVRLGMSSFLYYNNDFSVTGNPEVAAHYYGYMSGTWKDGTPFTYGGTGYGGTVLSNYIFPSDPGDPTGWSECTEGNTPADRRYLESSGPFSLIPGAVNEVIVGAVWVHPPVSGGCQTTFDLIRIADQKAQSLFDAHFQLIGGPDAPDIAIRELDQQVVLSLTNGLTSNNVGESYEEADPLIESVISQLPDSVIEANPGITDSTYNFEGYKIYQLVDGSVSTSEFSDPSRAKLIYQCDIKNGVTKIINYAYDATLAQNVPTLEVDGADKGIQHTFLVTDDAFATGNSKLINFKTYYFSVVAYAYNNFLPYDPTNSNSQQHPYLEGRKNIKIYTAIPHKPAPENDGMVLNAAYGDGPEIKRIEGAGNGGNYLELSDETVNDIFANGTVQFPIYKGRHGPVDVKIYDPVKVPQADFTLKLVDSTNSDPVNTTETWWVLTNNTTGEQVISDFPISVVNEQLLPQWGLSITVRGVNDPGGMVNAGGVYVEKEDNNGFLGASISYDDPSKQWLNFVPDVDGTYQDWIRAGTATGTFADVTSPPNQDNNQVYEGVLGGTWGPTGLVAFNTDLVPYMPLRNISGLRTSIPISETEGVDVVFTPDKSKWSKCIVVETGEVTLLNGTQKLDMKQLPSRDIDGNEIAGSTGYSYFPGYAIDEETGKRVNIFFGEDGGPEQPDARGNDMFWNPSSTFLSPSSFDPIYGGKHYLYVTKTPYDQCQGIHDSLLWVSGTPPSTTNYRNEYASVVWISMPLLASGYSSPLYQTMEIPTETRVELRVTKEYAMYFVNGANLAYPIYTFSTRAQAPLINNDSVASSALDLIRAVPNPYYAYSAYETGTLDNDIKITNLPSKCTVSIYMMDGTLIRRFNRDLGSDNSEGNTLNSKSGNLDTSLDWDLTNSKNVPVASGMYIIHVDAGPLGQKTIKWFGVMRPIDLSDF